VAPSASSSSRPKRLRVFAPEPGAGAEEKRLGSASAFVIEQTSAANDGLARNGSVPIPARSAPRLCAAVVFACGLAAVLYVALSFKRAESAYY